MNARQPFAAAPEGTQAPAQTGNPDRYAPDDLQLLLAESQLRDLARIRQLAMESLEEEQMFRTREFRAGRHPKNDLAIARFEKAIRQIMVLEQEVCGMRAKRRIELRQRQGQQKKAEAQREVRTALLKAKPGIGRIDMMNCMSKAFSDYNDYNDYYRGSVAEIVAQICKDLGIEHNAQLWQEPAANAPETGTGDDLPGADDAGSGEASAWQEPATRIVAGLANRAVEGAGCGPPSG